MTGSKRHISMAWVALAILSLAILSFRLQLNFNLGVFFPDSNTLNHQILLEQLRNGPGSRLLVIGLSGVEHDRLAGFSDQLKQKLATGQIFVNVLNGDFEIESSGIPEPVNSYYLLLEDIDFSKASLHKAIESRQRDLAFGGGDLLLKLIAKDPFLQTLSILQRLAPANTAEGIWFSGNGSAVLMAETKAVASDLGAQALAIETIRNAFSDINKPDGVEIEITGVGAFGVELQEIIRAEAKKRTMLASAVLMLILLLIYRKPRLLLIVSLPLAMGFLVGLALITLVFGSVHGITLAFGFTLMGIAIDYPLHLFSHSRKNAPADAIKAIWPTLRIGALSTAIAYVALSLSGSQGLAQLGLFTATGVIVAALVTRTWLPQLITGPACGKAQGLLASISPKLVFLPALACVVLSVLAIQYLGEGKIWDDQLSSLSPVPKQRLLTDNTLRSAAATADMRYQLVLHATSLETLLRQNEALDTLLQEAVNDGFLGGWQSASQLLPSQHLQKRRQATIPGSEQLATRLNEALQGSAFREDAFVPFLQNADSVKHFASLTPEFIANTELASWLESHLIFVAGQWVSLISLSQPQPEKLAVRIKTWDIDVDLIDLQQSSQALVSNYRVGALKTILFASLAIIMLLLIDQRQVQRIAWIAVTVVSALSVTVATVVSLHDGLTIIHLVALLLVIGLGLDYALFLSRQETSDGQMATRHAVLACAATTTATFGILAMSSIPVLKFLGLTVAIGSISSFLLAWAGSSLYKQRISPDAN